MGWTIKDDKFDYVGKLSVPHLEVREKLVGFTTDVLPPEGAQVVRDGRISGRVTSARASERVGGVIGLAWVDPEHAEEASAISIRVDGTLHPATVTLAPFYDPEGALLRS
jgi:glycine cleavage system aminomethyltransferase T